MVCDDFRSRGRVVRIPFERLGDSGVQLSSCLAQQHAIGSIPHQRVLEAIGRLRGRALDEQEVGVDQPIERGL